MIIEKNRIVMRAPDNWHAHFRQDRLMEYLIPVFLDSGWRHRIVAEPNTVPPILTGKAALEYAGNIRERARLYGEGQTLEPVITIQITEATTAQMVREAFALGVRVAKVYPRYVTTHSHNGVVDYSKIYPALAVADELGMVVQFHPEHPSYDVIGRLKESAFRRILDGIRATFPSLRISVEHVSSEDMVLWVMDQPTHVGASITVHHLYVTSDDLTGYSERSGGLICVHDGAFKPGAKDPGDRDAIRRAALSGNPRFWYGGDDAAHVRKKKECARGACGSFNTIPALSLVLSFFEKSGELERSEPFLSEFGALFYGFGLNKENATFVREEWTVPMEYLVPDLNDVIVPFFAGEKMEWKFCRNL